MTDYVLVHGGNMSTDTWNRFTIADQIHTDDGLMGGRIWDPLIPDIEARGGRVFAPTLLDEHRCHLTDHLDQVSDVLTGNDLHDVVLAGHSYGGMVITGTAARHADRVRGMLYVDAALPDPGQSLFDIIAAGGTDPLSIPGLEPDLPYVEQIEFDPAEVRPLRKTYLRCTESDFSMVTRLAQDQIAAGTAGPNWTYTELPSWHVPMANMPDRVSELLAAL
jgi:pimeloyl-ACP methyl ester carboxylesterase